MTDNLCCQRCAGKIEGWTCQSCGQEFSESPDGRLVFCEPVLDAAPRPAPGREAVQAILRPMVLSVASSAMFTAHERDDYLRRKTDSILALFADQGETT